MRSPIGEGWSPERWQDAVDSAYVAQLIDDCQGYGLIVGPTIDRNRCAEILEAGKARGLAPRSDAIERLIRGAVPDA